MYTLRLQLHQKTSRRTTIILLKKRKYVEYRKEMRFKLSCCQSRRDYPTARAFSLQLTRFRNYCKSECCTQASARAHIHTDCKSARFRVSRTHVDHSRRSFSCSFSRRDGHKLFDSIRKLTFKVCPFSEYKRNLLISE